MHFEYHFFVKILHLKESFVSTITLAFFEDGWIEAYFNSPV